MSSCALLALITTPLLSGCVVAAIPVIAAGAMGKSAIDRKSGAAERSQPAAAPPSARQAPPETRADLPAIRPTLPPAPPLPATVVTEPAPPPVPADEPAAPPRPPEPVIIPAVPAPDTPVTVEAAPPPAADTLAELEAAATPFAGFAAFAVDAARRRTAGEAVAGVVPVPEVSLGAPQMLPCEGPVGVIVDLDPASGDLAPDASATPGLVAALDRLRGAGVAINWIAGDEATARNAQGMLLARGLLTPADQLLRPGAGAGDRKQIVRQRLATRQCIVAIAGDKRGDFDELFDFLRDPAATTPLDGTIGAGWFLTPPPLRQP